MEKVLQEIVNLQELMSIFLSFVLEKQVYTPLSLPEEWMGNVKTSTTNRVRWGSLMRSGSGAL